jgi:hypothetical protein
MKEKGLQSKTQSVSMIFDLVIVEDTWHDADRLYSGIKAATEELRDFVKMVWDVYDPTTTSPPAVPPPLFHP